MTTAIATATFPAELCEWPQWVCWKYSTKDGKQTKLPINAHTGKLASSTDPQTWATFEDAQAKQNGNAGIGFVFSANDPYCGIDFDGCYREDTGEIAPWAQRWIAKLNSYSEISPSKTGIKVWVKAKWPLPSGKKISIHELEFVAGKQSAIEVYDHARYFAVTGMRLSDYPADIQERQSIVDEICKAHFSEKCQAPNPDDSNNKSSHTSVMDRARKYVLTIPGAVAGSGGHNQTFHVSCVLMQGFDLSKTEALTILREYNQSCLPPWSEKELEHKIDSADKQLGERGYLRDKQPAEWNNVSIPNYQEPQQHQQQDKNPSKYEPGIRSDLDLLSHLNNDHGNAERLIAASGNVLRYCHQMRKWLAWDGKRWAVDETRQAYKLAKNAMLEYVQQAHKAGIELHEKYSRQSLDTKRINALLESAQCEIYIAPDKLDSHPYLLNCNNGVVDLRSGQLHPHNPDLYITKLIHFDYDQEAQCPMWKAFLYRLMGLETNPDAAERLVKWLQKALGYSLTSSTREKAVFICWGPTDAGKSTLLSTFRSIIEEYSTLLQIDTLMVRREETNNSLSDLSDLRGCRFAQTSETEKGQRLAEGKLKRVSQGMGKIKACRKYENPISFKEECKIWADANHKPRINGNDSATWNRLYPIPFTVQIPKEEQDRELPDKLMGEALGILTWAVAGAVRWYAEGLGKPEEIEAANRDWQADEDIQGKFIAECLDVGGDTEAARVYKLYQWWCEKNGEKPESSTAFGKGMTERGYERGSAVGTRRTVYRNIAIILTVEDDFEADQHKKKGGPSLFGGR